MDKNNHTPSSPQSEIDLIALSGYLWKKRRFFIKCCGIATVAGLIIAFSIPKEFTTTVKLAPETTDATSKMSNLGGLAAMAGIDLGSASGQDALSPNLYPDIVHSTPFLLELFPEKVTDKEKKYTTTLYDYIAGHQRFAWWSILMKAPLKGIAALRSFFSGNEENDGDLNPFQLTHKQEDVLKNLRQRITVYVDKKTQVVTLGVSMQDLHASINGKEILKGINLTIRDGEVHALMGQNGAGKSTLSNVLVGHPAYEVTRGSITFNGKDLLAMSPEDRAHEGIFLSFQAPVEIPGVSMVNFMRAAVNEQRKYRHLPALSASEFLKLMREKRAIVELDNKLANRSVNEGFSGGEKKRNEIFQMAMLEPTFAILDETDSGLDVDALRIVADGFNKLKTAETSAMVITHYQRLLDYIKPDTVHVLLGGRIVKTGGPELAKEIETRGFDWIRKEAGEL